MLSRKEHALSCKIAYSSCPLQMFLKFLILLSLAAHVNCDRKWSESDPRKLPTDVYKRQLGSSFRNTSAIFQNQEYLRNKFSKTDVQSRGTSEQREISTHKDNLSKDMMAFLGNAFQIDYEILKNTEENDQNEKSETRKESLEFVILPSFVIDIDLKSEFSLSQSTSDWHQGVFPTSIREFSASYISTTLLLDRFVENAATHVMSTPLESYAQIMATKTKDLNDQKITDKILPTTESSDILETALDDVYYKDDHQPTLLEYLERDGESVQSSDQNIITSLLSSTDTFRRSVATGLTFSQLAHYPPESYTDLEEKNTFPFPSETEKLYFSDSTDLATFIADLVATIPGKHAFHVATSSKLHSVLSPNTNAENSRILLDKTEKDEIDLPILEELKSFQQMNSLGYTLTTVSPQVQDFDLLASTQASMQQGMYDYEVQVEPSLPDLYSTDYSDDYFSIDRFWEDWRPWEKQLLTGGRSMNLESVFTSYINRPKYFPDESSVVPELKNVDSSNKFSTTDVFPSKNTLFKSYDYKQTARAHIQPSRVMKVNLIEDLEDVEADSLNYQDISLAKSSSSSLHWLETVAKSVNVKLWNSENSVQSAWTDKTVYSVKTFASFIHSLSSQPFDELDSEISASYNVGSNFPQISHISSTVSTGYEHPVTIDDSEPQTVSLSTDYTRAFVSSSDSTSTRSEPSTKVELDTRDILPTLTFQTFSPEGLLISSLISDNSSASSITLHTSSLRSTSLSDLSTSVSAARNIPSSLFETSSNFDFDSSTASLYSVGQVSSIASKPIRTSFASISNSGGLPYTPHISIKHLLMTGKTSSVRKEVQTAVKNKSEVEYSPETETFTSLYHSMPSFEASHFAPSFSTRLKLVNTATEILSSVSPVKYLTTRDSPSNSTLTTESPSASGVTTFSVSASTVSSYLSSERDTGASYSSRHSWTKTTSIDTSKIPLVPSSVSRIASSILSTLVTSTLQISTLKVPTLPDLPPHVTTSQISTVEVPTLPDLPPHVTAAQILSINIIVKLEVDVTDQDFLQTIEKGLSRCFEEGKAKNKSRRRRSYPTVFAKVFYATRHADELSHVEVQFYVSVDDVLLRASDAVVVYSRLSLPETSAYLTYPVLSPVEVVFKTATMTPETSTDIPEKSALTFILIGISSGCIFIAVIIVAILLWRRSRILGEPVLCQKEFPTYSQNPRRINADLIIDIARGKILPHDEYSKSLEQKPVEVGHIGDSDNDGKCRFTIETEDSQLENEIDTDTTEKDKLSTVNLEKESKITGVDIINDCLQHKAVFDVGQNTEDESDEGDKTYYIDEFQAELKTVLQLRSNAEKISSPSNLSSSSDYQSGQKIHNSVRHISENVCSFPSPASKHTNQSTNKSHKTASLSCNSPKSQNSRDQTGCKRWVYDYGTSEDETDQSDENSDDELENYVSNCQGTTKHSEKYENRGSCRSQSIAYSCKGIRQHISETTDSEKYKNRGSDRSESRGNQQHISETTESVGNFKQTLSTKIKKRVQFSEPLPVTPDRRQTREGTSVQSQRQSPHDCVRVVYTDSIFDDKV